MFAPNKKKGLIMAEYKQTLYISKEMNEYINNALQSTDYMGEDDTISKTAVFDNEIEMDIKLCGADYDYPWTEAVLFKNGSECCCSEPCEGFVGEWQMEYNGDTYIVIIEVER